MPITARHMPSPTGLGFETEAYPAFRLRLHAGLDCGLRSAEWQRRTREPCWNAPFLVHLADSKTSKSFRQNHAPNTIGKHQRSWRAIGVSPIKSRFSAGYAHKSRFLHRFRSVSRANALDSNNAMAQSTPKFERESCQVCFMVRIC